MTTSSDLGAIGVFGARAATDRERRWLAGAPADLIEEVLAEYLPRVIARIEAAETTAAAPQKVVPISPARRLGRVLFAISHDQPGLMAPMKRRFYARMALEEIHRRWLRRGDWVPLLPRLRRKELPS